MVSDDQGTTSEELLESALVANIHRQDLEELDEARALQRLLAIHGSQTALAKRLQRSQGWVSQRLALLNLTPDLWPASVRNPSTCCAPSATNRLRNRRRPLKNSRRSEPARKPRSGSAVTGSRRTRVPLQRRTHLPSITA
ncbi:ParB/RepB/Spo0J family partition protein [Streptomyces canus]